MSESVIVYKGRTNVVGVSLGIDVASDTFASDIRKEHNRESELIVSWDVSFVTDGTDGELLLTLDDSETSNIEVKSGYMDLKRITGGEPISVFETSLQVVFRETVTA